MADLAFLKKQWERMSKREQVLTGITIAVVLSALLYQFPYSMRERSNSALVKTIAATDEEILDLTTRLTDLRVRAAEIKAGAKAGIPGKELISEQGVVLLLEDVAIEARRLGVSLVSVHPTQALDRDRYKEVAVNLDLKARYREVGEYFKRLENLARVVNIRKLRMEACPDASSVCAVQIEAVGYMSK